jgi:hypothetical protein
MLGSRYPLVLISLIYPSPHLIFVPNPNYDPNPFFIFYMLNFRDSNNSPVSSTLIVSKVSWSDPSTFPPQADILLGSDLVYDAKILSLLTQAVDGMLKPGNTNAYTISLSL